MNEQLHTVTEAASWFEDLLKFESFMSLCLSMVISWCAVRFLAFVIRRYAAAEWRTFVFQLIDVLIAFAVCAATWPHAHRWVWAIAAGVLSPVLYLIGVSWLLCKLVPGLKPLLSLQELAPEEPTTRPTSNEANGDTK